MREWGWISGIDVGSVEVTVNRSPLIQPPPGTRTNVYDRLRSDRKQYRLSREPWRVAGDEISNYSICTSRASLHLLHISVLPYPNPPPAAPLHCLSNNPHKRAKASSMRAAGAGPLPFHYHSTFEIKSNGSIHGPDILDSRIAARISNEISACYCCVFKALRGNGKVDVIPTQTIDGTYTTLDDENSYKSHQQL